MTDLTPSTKIVFPPGTAPETKGNVKAICALARASGSREWHSINVKTDLLRGFERWNIPHLRKRIPWAVEWLCEKGYADRVLSPSKKSTVKLTLHTDVDINDPEMLELTQLERDRLSGKTPQEAPADGYHRSPREKTMEPTNGHVVATTEVARSRPALPPTPEQFMTPECITELTFYLKDWFRSDPKTCDTWIQEVTKWLKAR